MSWTFAFRGLLLNPVILGGIFVLLTPLVLWRAHRFLARGAGVGATLDQSQRLVGMLVALSLFAGILTAVAGRWGTPLGDLFRLRALQRTAVATEAPPGVRLLAERSRVSSYAGIDEYTADQKDPPDTTDHSRTYRVEANPAEVLGGFVRLAEETGWKLASLGCGTQAAAPTPELHRSGRRYERRIAGFRATLSVISVTLPSTAFPGTAITNVVVSLRAPSVLAGGLPSSSRAVDQACLAPPPALPRPPVPPGACEAANRKLAVAVPDAAAPLGSVPLRIPRFTSDLRRLQVRPADEQFKASRPPSEPRSMLERHGAIDGYRDFREVVPDPGSLQRRESIYAYQFPSPEAARAFHEDAVARACAQAVEAFDVPGVPDAVGLRLYAPATGPECREREDQHWGLGSFLIPGCGDWLIDYVAFARGQYHVSVAVGGAEQERYNVASLRGRALQAGEIGARRACEVRADAALAARCG